MELGKKWVTHRGLILSLLGGLVLLGLSVVCYFFVLASQPKQVTLTLDGDKQSYETRAETVEQFLAEQQITVQDKDVLIPDGSTPITDEMTINLQTSWAVPVVVDAQRKIVHSVKRDVAS